MAQRSDAPMRHLSRGELVERMRARLATDGFPRAQMTFIVSVAGGAAFGCSVAALRLGVAHMGLRYGLAAIGGYLAFLAMIRLWVAWQRGRIAPEDSLDLSDLVDATVSSVADRPADEIVPALFGGGRGGGGGASAAWGSRGTPGASIRGATGSAKVDRPWLDLDLDDAWPVLLAIGCAALGLVAVLYTIWMAPLLLAEIALDAALVTALYRKLRKTDAGSWIGAALRRTWLPALAIVVLMTIAGSALQYAVPGARSIGGVVAALLNPESS